MLLLIKFGSLEHLRLLRENGKVYCKELGYFSKVKDENIRGDEFETITELKYMEHAVLSLRPANDPNVGWKEIKVSSAQIKTSVSGPTGNLFCVSGIEINPTVEEKQLSLNEKFLEFGSHYPLINNALEFINRIRNALDKLNFPFDEGNVEYLELKKFSGKKSIFQKDLLYSWQEEYRFFIRSGFTEPLILGIGDIKEISSIHEFKIINKFKYKLP